MHKRRRTRHQFENEGLDYSSLIYIGSPASGDRTFLVLMPVVNIRDVRVRMRYRLMLVRMDMRLLAIPIEVMLMLVVLVVGMRMRMSHWNVGMRMFMFFRQMQPDSGPHQRASEPKAGTWRIA